MKNLRSPFRLCFVIIVIIFGRIVYSSENDNFHVISTTELPIKPQPNQKDFAKFCFDFTEIKLQEIVQQNNEKLEGKIQKQLQNIENKILMKTDESQNIVDNFRSENKKEIQEIQSEILYKFEGKMQKQLQDMESKILMKFEQTKNFFDNKIEQIQNKIITKIEDKENVSKTQQEEEILINKKLLEEIEVNILNKIKNNQREVQEIQHAEISPIGVSLELKNQTTEDTLVLNNVTVPENCQSVLERGNTSTGIYTIQPKKSDKSFDVLCNMDIREGGWTYILNRFDGSQIFNVKWEDYKNGFGSLTGEFWLGLQKIHEMTSGHPNTQLFVQIVDWDNVTRYALYNNFKVGNETEKYKIESVGKYTGNALDCLRQHVNYPFIKSGNTAWWYRENLEYFSHLTGVYRKMDKTNYYGRFMWCSVRGSLQKAKMMIRPGKLENKN